MRFQYIYGEICTPYCLAGSKLEWRTQWQDSEDYENDHDPCEIKFRLTFHMELLHFAVEALGVDGDLFSNGRAIFFTELYSSGCTSESAMQEHSE